MHMDRSTSYNKNVGSHVEKDEYVELDDIYGTDVQNKIQSSPKTVVPPVEVNTPTTELS